FFFFSSRRRHTRSDRDWSSDVCSSDLREPSSKNRARRSSGSRGSGVRSAGAAWTVVKGTSWGPKRWPRRGPGSDGGEDQRDVVRSEEHTSELQSRSDLVCRLLLEKKKK